LEYTQRCIQAAETSKQPKLLYIAYSNLGIYYLEIPDLKKADSVYYKLLDFLPALSAKGKISFYNNYAETKRLMKEYAKAKEYIDSCYKLSVIEKDTFWLGIALVNKGNLSIANKNNTQAIKECSLALQYAKKFKSLVWQKNSCECLFEAFEKNNDHKNALTYYKNARILSDSVLNEKNKNEATQKDFQYKYAIKTAADSIKQIESNKVKDAQIKAQQSQLNEEKIVRISLLIVAVLVLVFAAFTYNRFKSSQKQRAIIEEQKRITDIQKNLLEEKQKEIIDSINYAKRIQQTLLAHDVFLQENIPDLFTLFIPKDIVSGDYYWAIKKNSKFYLAVCDSTGHGVPGAFMSLLNIGFLSEAISERGIEKPNEIFDFVRQRLIENISKEGQRDGFDGILICIDKLTNEMTYAAANNAPVIIHQNQLLTLPSNRMPVGIGEKKDHFDLFSVEMKKGDCLYLYTDGYADQFGGEKGKKFKYKQLNELLISINHLSLPEQKKLLEEAYKAWKGALEQVDDICIIGIRA
jgi:serine phosphatase RsbU (regulator of sigma subunit)